MSEEKDGANLPDWWSDDELEICPLCNEKKLVPEGDSPVRWCLSCGVVLGIDARAAG